MAYSKTSNKYQDKEVKYLSKDYNSFKDQLLTFAQSYFPNNFNDFSEGNPAMMMLEMSAYVGDVLSFYTDTQLRESILSLAEDPENIYNIAYSMGYRPKISTAASVNLDISQIVPADSNNNYEPDYNFALTIGANSTFSDPSTNTGFYTTKATRFGFSSSFEPTTKDIYQYDNSNNPEYWLLKKTVPAISANLKTQQFTIEGPERFKTLNLFDRNIISIESITDTEGNEWSEVPYLACDTIFEEVENTGANDPKLHQYNNETPYLLKIKRTTKRFISRIKNTRELIIQFGAGTSDKADEQIIPNPDNIGLGIKDGRNKLDTAFDPSNFLYTKTYGEAPSNTVLTVTYLVGGGLDSNVDSNTITENTAINTSYKPEAAGGMLNFVQNSISVTNPLPARGGGERESLEEVRMNTMAHFAAQQRTVTKEDYIIRTLSMPSQFGRVAKAYITQDDQLSPITGEVGRIPNPLALNLYTLGYDNEKSLTTLNLATKNNLMTYLEQFRMLTDAINIKDAFVINFSLDFEIITFKNYNNQDVLINCINELKSFFNIEKWQINQPINISEVYNAIAGVGGVQSIVDISFNNKSGLSQGYSLYKYSFNKATKNGVIYPSMDPSIFELKYPDSDINGRVTTY